MEHESARSRNKDSLLKRDRSYYQLIAVLGPLLLIFGADSGASNSEVTRGELGSQLALRMGARTLGRAESHAKVKGSIHFKLNNEQELDRLLSDQQDPASRNHRRWLTPEEFGRRFGPPTSLRDGAVEWLQRAGISITRIWPGGSGLEFEAAAELIEQSFNVRIALFEMAGEIRYANEDKCKLPSSWGAGVETVRLHNLRLTRPGAIEREQGISPAFNSGGTVAIGPQDFYVAYNLNSLLGEGIDGSGQTIAILGRSDFNLSDTTRYREAFDLAPGQVVKIPAGGEIRNLGGGDEAEVLLDAQLAGMAAPAATIQVVISDKDSDLDQSLAFAVNNLPDTKVINISFGACERDLMTTFQSVFNNMYKQAAAQGQTVLVSSGDSGADQCGDGSGRQVNGLASSPFVTAVGGTALRVRFDADGDVIEYRDERVWPGSGGGSSLVYSRPAYQSDIGTLEGMGRMLPDVAMLADPVNPGFFFVRGGVLRVIGGTSASAPCWAGIFALVNQFTDASGLGCVNSRLYELGTAAQQGGPAVFNDVTEGTNDQGGSSGFPATAGYDLSTGWGSPNTDWLVRNFPAPADEEGGIFLLQPNGGEFFPTDSTIRIKWRASSSLAPRITTQDVLLSTDEGQTFVPIASNLASDVRSFDFVASNLVTATARFRALARMMSGAALLNDSDTDVNIGSELRIEFVQFGSKRLELLGSGFGGGTRLIVNGSRLEIEPKSFSGDSLTFKAKKKKLGLKTGENEIIVDADGIRSSPYRLLL